MTTPPPGERHRMVRAEQVQLLYSNAALGLSVTILNAAILVFLQWRVISHAVLIAWLAYMVTLSLARSVLAYRYWRTPPPPFKDDRWGIWYTTGVALAGLGWGSAGVFLFPEESLKHQVFLAFVLGGMGAGAATVLSSLREAFLAFIIPTMLPITVRFFAQGDDVHVAMGAMAALFMLATLATAWRIHATLLASLNLRFENRDLVAYLSTAKGQAEKLNEELTFEIDERKRAHKERERLIAELQDAAASIKVLQGILPICSHCKKIRDDAGHWHVVEVYVSEHSNADFSHGICPECLNRMYPEFGRNNPTI